MLNSHFTFFFLRRFFFIFFFPEISDSLRKKLCNMLWWKVLHWKKLRIMKGMIFSFIILYSAKSSLNVSVVIGVGSSWPSWRKPLWRKCTKNVMNFSKSKHTVMWALSCDFVTWYKFRRRENSGIWRALKWICTQKVSLWGWTHEKRMKIKMKANRKFLKLSGKLKEFQAVH